MFTWLQASAGWSWALKEAVRAENSEREEKLESQRGVQLTQGPGVAGVKVCDAKRQELLSLERVSDITWSIPPSRNSQPEGTELGNVQKLTASLGWI